MTDIALTLAEVIRTDYKTINCVYFNIAVRRADMGPAASGSGVSRVRQTAVEGA